MELRLDGMPCRPESLFFFETPLQAKIGSNAETDRLRVRVTGKRKQDQKNE
jgi:hypothetical protein